MMKPTTLLFALAALPALSQTAEPVSWDAAGNPPQTARLQVWRGDTVPLAPRWGSSSTNGWTFAAYWSTNNTEWWSKSLAPGAYDLAGNPFVWSPDMDVGARRYRLFIRAATAGGASYRANAEITMLDSPGSSPASLPPPDAWPALAAEVIPFMLPYLPTYSAWTNEAAARASADAGLQLQIDALASGGGTGTGTVSAANSDTALRLRSADGSRLLDATGGVWLVHGWLSNTLVVADSTVPAGYEVDIGSAWPWTVEDLGSFYAYNKPDGMDLTNVGRVYLQDGAWKCQLLVDDLPLLAGGSTPDGTYTGAAGSITFRYAYTSGTAVTSALPGVAFMDDLSGALSGLCGDAITNTAIVASNALVQAQAARADVSAATNALVNVYLLGTNAWITADWSNQTVSVSLVGTNGTNTVTVGGPSSSVDPAATNLLWQALASGLASKADKAWGKYTPDGTANPDPAYMTWLSSPATVFASGTSWTTYGAYAALSTAGAVAFESGGDGALRIGPDSTNWFGFVAGGSVLVGAVPGGITVTAGGTEGGFAEIDFEFAGGDFPTLWYTPSLSADFTELAGVWVDNLDGTATVTAPATSAAGFYKATTSASWSTVFHASMPARFAAGIIGATNAVPVVYDSVIQISSGGHTYRIPAQLVE